MKSVLEIVKRGVKAVMILFSRQAGERAGKAHLREPGQAPVAQQDPEKDIQTNIFLLLKEYPAFASMTKDVLLLRRRLKHFERLKLRGGPEAAAAWKQLHRQWKRVVRNKMTFIEKENAHRRDIAEAREQRNSPVNGCSTSARSNDPGLSAGQA